MQRPTDECQGIIHGKDLSLYIEKEGCEDLIDSQILTAFLASLYVVYLLCGLYKASYTV